MPFYFLKFLQPTHYFQLFKTQGASVFPVVSELPIEVREQLILNPIYLSKRSQEYDLSWQAIQRGYIGNTLCYNNFKSLPLEDEYRFIRTYFHTAWVFYVLFLRLCSLCNPIKELHAFFKTRKVFRVVVLSDSIQQKKYQNFNSILLTEKPLVSVIIPTLNRYIYLKKVFKDLEEQNYLNFEVLVVDQTEAFDASVYEGWNLNLRCWQQKEKALWRARNEAIQEAKGEYFLLYDDDSLVDPNWISSHLKAIDYFKADISSGVSLSVIGAEVPKNYTYFRVSDQLDTGNVLIKRSVFETVGLFDRQFEKQRMGDGEFGLRCYLSGFLNVSNPDAKRVHLKVGYGGLRELGSWDAFRPKNILAPRPIPSVTYFYRRYFGSGATLLALLRMIPLSLIPYRYKNNKMLLILSVILSVFLLPFVFFQAYRSWKAASEKLKEGSKIQALL
ncbi:glycosyltransferase family 2 protein [Winogradskyella undariae]|uniref:glycosyltransferase family 2 protein n=1 Tax=Winogradskyella undariae TaxID=1285465 RepID=UPI0015C6C023|nr:glycosyltransferase family A protein [Winogradskyella undariae]